MATRLATLLLLILSAATASVASAEAQPAHTNTAYDRCSRGAWPSTTEQPNPDLFAIAQQAESLLASAGEDVAARAVRVLDGAEATAAQSSDYAVPASYCAALGEAFRRDPTRGPVKSRLILRRSIGLAVLEQDRLTTARAAYRLTLATDGMSDMSWSTDETRMRELRQTSAAAGHPCIIALLGDTNRLLTCAYQEAEAASDTRLQALIALRQWRRHDPARDIPGTRDRFLQQLTSTLGALADKPMATTDLEMRLIETLIDAGAVGNDEVASGLSRIADHSPTDPGHGAFSAAMAAKQDLIQGAKSDAVSHLVRAIALESQKPTPDRLPEWFLLLANADDPVNRSTHLDRARRALQAVEPHLPAYDPLTEESLFSLRTRKVFEEVLEATLAGDIQSNTFQTIRPVVESYRRAELASVYGEDCVEPLDPIEPAELREGEILLYPIQLSSRLDVFYATKDTDGFQHLVGHQQQSREDTDDLVTELRRLVRQQGGLEERRNLLAANVYDLIIAPLERRSPEFFQASTDGGTSATLVISPDGPLRAAPYAALVDERGEYLVSKAHIVLAPSLSYLQTGGAAPPERQGVEVLAAALTARTELDEDIFSELGATESEARIAAEFGRARLLPQQPALVDFSVQALTDALSSRSVDILHLATHASFSGRGSHSYLVARDGTVPISELKQLINQNRAMGEQLQLLILSACETALGDDEASMGLAGAAVQSGAVSAIASLWKVNDPSTKALMENFYRHYATMPVSEALRRAQLDMINDDGGKYAEPYYWASFILIGGWR